MTAPVTAPPGGPAVRSPRREIPRQAEDYTAAAARRRLAFLTETTGVTPEHLGRGRTPCRPAVLDVEQFPASRYLFLRFDYTTGDAAGQNLTGKATLRACDWIRASRPPCSAARSRWARPWWPTNGSPRTSGSAGTAPRRKSCHPRWTG